MQVDRFLGSTLAILLLFIGKGLVAGVEPLRRYRDLAPHRCSS